MVVHLNDETAPPAEKPADERTALLDDDRVRILVDLDAEPFGHPRLEEVVERAPPAAAGIGRTSHHTTVSRSPRLLETRRRHPLAGLGWVGLEKETLARWGTGSVPGFPTFGGERR